MLKLSKVADADAETFVATKDGKTKPGVYGDALRWLCDGEPPEALVEILGGPIHSQRFEVQHLRKALEPSKRVRS